MGKETISNEEKAVPPIGGVALLIRDRVGRFLVVKENNSKPENKRKAGDLGVPCETREIGESLTKTVARAMEEELNIPFGFQADVLLFNRDLGVHEFVEGKKSAVVLLYDCLDPRTLELSVSGEEKESEVSFEGWCFPEELMQKQNLREGVRRILDSIYSQGLLK